jgi:PAS domain S-box-containing protein
MRLLANLVENAQLDMILVVESDGQMVESNASARELFGYPKEELMRQNIGRLLTSEGDETWERIAASVEKESHWQGDLLAIHRMGESTPVRVSVSRYVDRTENRANMICFLRDISEEKEIDRMKSEFVSVASHEMRTPLTSIKSAVDLILKGRAGEITDSQRKFLSIAERNIDRFIALIEDLLDISKIEARQVELDNAEFAMEELIEKAMNTLKVLADEHSISLRRISDPHLPQVYGDASRIEQVLTNLIGNAVKFTPDKGTITIEASRVRGTPGGAGEDGGGVVQVSVTDTGVGIPEDQVEHVFAKFYQAESSLSTKRQPGTGLGLAITKGIVEAHGGTISCESKIGVGSTFRFTLPIVDRTKQFYKDFSNELARAKRHSLPLSILLLAVNSEYEHLRKAHGQKRCGEMLRVIMKGTFNGTVRNTDRMCGGPWDGEVVLLMRDTDRAGAQVVEKRIYEHMPRNAVGGGEVKYDPILSAGVAMFPADGQTPEELLRVAREAAAAMIK